MSESTCPLCNKPVSHKTLNTNYRGVIGVHQCPACNAIFGTCYKGESYNVVLPYWSKETSMDNAVYYDLEVLGGEGIERRHGWMNPEDNCILQVG